jgi:hypothetical protein
MERLVGFGCGDRLKGVVNIPGNRWAWNTVGGKPLRRLQSGVLHTAASARCSGHLKAVIDGSRDKRIEGALNSGFGRWLLSGGFGGGLYCGTLV